MDRPLDNTIIRRFRRDLRQFERHVVSQFKTCSCSVTLPQCHVLLNIDEEGQMTMGQLASNLRLDHSTLSRTVEGLVRRKLLARLRDEGDRRVVWVRLTSAGAAVCKEIHDSNDAYCRKVFEQIKPAERMEVIRYFEALIRAYRDQETEADQA